MTAFHHYLENITNDIPIDINKRNYVKQPHFTIN